MKTDSYFQFPISALSYGLQRENRWEHVIFYACLHYGRKAVQKTPPFEVASETRSYVSAHPGVQDAPRDQINDQTALLFGLKRLQINSGNLSALQMLSLAADVENHCEAHPFPLVRIRTDFWRKSFGNNRGAAPITFREFCVLCAVYALNGTKTFAKASLDRIRRFAAGIPDRANFDHALNHPETAPGSLLLSTRQARTTLDALEANRFFAKFTYNRGECFYSIRMNRSQLAVAVAKRKLWKNETVATNRALDRSTSAEIKERLQNCSTVWSKAA